MTKATIQEQEVEKGNLDDLSFVRLRIPSLIPIELIEGVKGRTFTPEQFYDYQEMQVDNQNNHLYVLVDKSSKIHGYLWAEQNSLDASLFVNTFSITKRFWGKGEAIGKAVDFLHILKDKTKAPRVFWCSSNEKFFLKHGFKRSKISLMEYKDEVSIGTK